LMRWPVLRLIWLKLIFSESDVAGYKATGHVTRERRKKPFQLASPASAQRVLDHMAESADPLAALCRVPCPPRAGDDWNAIVETVGNLRYSEWLADLERARLRYEPHLDRVHEDAEVRRADLIQLEQIACGYPSRERFLTELTLDPPDATSDQAGVPLLDEDYLILSTIHSAKGQEWKSVYVLNMVDGCVPSDLGAGTSAELEEKRRLLYLAMTQPRTIFISWCRSLLHPRAAFAGRSAHLRVADPLHSRKAARLVRANELARGGAQRRNPAVRAEARGSTSAPGCAACGADGRA
jgi:superfamily I DNA/RNA helicase